MKHIALSLVVLMASLTATAGTISKTYNFSSSQVEVNTVTTDNTLMTTQTTSKAKKAASDYTPMVVEGKTWWQSTEGWPKRFNVDHYYYIEVGFTIGSEVEIDGVKWNKLYISHYRDGVNYIEGVKWKEDESLLGYIREEDGKVFYLALTDEDVLVRFESLFGETYAILIPMYPAFDGREILIYDFNKRDFYIGSLGYESNPSDYYWKPYLLKYVSKESVNNSGREYEKYTYTHEEGYAAEGEETYFIEGIGMTESCGWLRHPLFFLPMINMEKTALSGLNLRYVTDKDYNILYEQEGGTKLWDEMAGVSTVAIDGNSNCQPVWYNMQGVKIAEPSTPGIYIRKAGNTTEKVVVK